MSVNPQWDITVDVRIDPPGVAGGAGELAALFGLTGERAAQTLYEHFHLTLRGGQVVAVVGPSGAGKTALLRAIAAQVGDPRRSEGPPPRQAAAGIPESRRGPLPGAVGLDLSAVRASEVPAADFLTGGEAPAVDFLTGGAPGSSVSPLEILSRCGLAEARALVTPARRLSGGQQHRLALASAVWRAIHGNRAAVKPCLPDGERGGDPARRDEGGPPVVLVDEFAGVLDFRTAEALAHQMPKLAARFGLAIVVATTRPELLRALKPACVIVKPLGEPPFVLGPEDDGQKSRAASPSSWPITPARLGEYHALGRFHYLAGPPAAHKRLWVVRVPEGSPPRYTAAGFPEPERQPGWPELAGVLVVSPPVLNCRGRNLATGGRYTGPDRRASTALLNAEIECISRVIVHPIYRGWGLSVRLVRHALRHAGTALVEALATMGAVHPFFQRAGMTDYGRFRGRTLEYSYYLAPGAGCTFPRGRFERTNDVE